MDHPRGCGEKPVARHLSEASGGSSPRVRGKVEVALGDPVAIGIIPAGAGKSWRPSPLRSSQRDHPRGCGEKREGREQAAKILGSSPRVRGKADREVVPIRQTGIIPAGAGKRGRPQR